MDSELKNNLTELCKKGGDHKNLPIVMICLEKECARKRMCCLTCVDDLHCKHELISIKKFENYILSTLNHNSSMKNREEMLGMLQKAKDAFKDRIQKVKMEFQRKIEGIIDQLQCHFEKIKDTFIQQKYENVAGDLIEQFTEEKVENIYKLTKEAENNLVKSVTEINEAAAASEKILSERTNNFLKDIEKHAENLEKAIMSFRITGKNMIKLFRFNPNTKAASLVIDAGGKTVKRGEGAGGYPIALVNEPFTEESNQVSLSILEEPANKACWLGVCAIDIVKNLNFQSCYGLGKGTWAIDQVGQNHVSAYSWSHHDSNYNSAPKVGFQFGVGDVITLRVDFQGSKVIFIKNNSATYEQPIKLDLGPIYAFAGPTNLNDVFTII